MILHFLRKYKWDLVVTSIAAVAAIVAVVLAHGSVKVYTGMVAAGAPLVFAGAIIAALTMIGVAGKARWLPGVLRVLLVTAVLSLVAPAAFLEVEKFVAPVEWWRGTTVAEVVQLIRSDRDSDRIRAWARIWTLSKEEKDQIAAAMVPLLLGADDGARHSAALTLDVSLRKHTLSAMAAMRTELRAYLTSRAAGKEPDESSRLAGEFAANFVQNNLTAVRKALAKNKRKYLPEGGLEALFLALATDSQLGKLYLRELSLHGDQIEKPLADSVMAMAAIPRPDVQTI